jgi:hypothetical protein
MRHIRIAILLALTAALVLPGAAMAYENQFEASLSSGSGDHKEPGVDADLSMSTFTLGYTRFFESIETGDSPYAMREFLQHPSKLFVTLGGMAMEIEATGGKMEVTQSALELGGVYHLESNTGLGASIASYKQEWEATGWGTAETSGTIITLFVDQYINETVLVGADYSSGSFETEYSNATEEFDETMFHVRAEALINNFVYLEAAIGSGKEKPDGAGEDTDLGEFSLVAGVFPSQQLGIYLSHDVETAEETGNTDETTTITMLSAEYFLNEAVGLRASVGSFKSEDKEDDSERDATMIGLGVSALF